MLLLLALCVVWFDVAAWSVVILCGSQNLCFMVLCCLHSFPVWNARRWRTRSIKNCTDPYSSLLLWNKNKNKKTTKEASTASNNSQSVAHICMLYADKQNKTVVFVSDTQSHIDHRRWTEKQANHEMHFLCVCSHYVRLICYYYKWNNVISSSSSSHGCGLFYTNTVLLLFLYLFNDAYHYTLYATNLNAC